MSQYPWNNSQDVIKTCNHIARISAIAAGSKMRIIIDSYGWIRLSKNGGFEGSMPLALLQEADTLTNAHVERACLAENAGLERETHE